MHRCKLLFILAFTTSICSAQINILDNKQVQENIEHCMHATYSFNFAQAHQYHRKISKQLPAHPASSFLKAIIIYWENFPMLPEDKAVAQFEKAMQQTIKLSQKILDNDPDNIIGIFFDMHARAYLAMFWADNGKSGKVIKDIDNMYKYTMEGIDRKDEFIEFYFSSGLYKYYIESYAENRPIYKAVLAVFRKGNKDKGLQELKYASQNTTFLKTEATFFLSLIELNYENDLHDAENYANDLYKNYPENIYYLSQYLTILCYNLNYDIAEILNENLKYNDNPYAHMVYKTTFAIVQEKKYKNNKKAQKLYWEVIKSAEHYGPRADIQAAISYAGLARIATEENRIQSARKHLRKSKSHSSYPYITTMQSH